MSSFIGRLPSRSGFARSPLRVPGAVESHGEQTAVLVTETATRRQATRYPIAARVLFRGQGETPWRVGETINVSRSGVLFRADGELPGQDASLDFILTLPVNCDALPRVRCRGHVVRIAPGTLPGGSHAVAVSIDGYALEGRARAEAEGTLVLRRGQAASTAVPARTGRSVH